MDGHGALEGEPAYFFFGLAELQVSTVGADRLANDVNHLVVRKLCFLSSSVDFWRDLKGQWGDSFLANP